MRIESTSVTWINIKNELEERLDKLYRAIAQEGVTEREADVMRGQLKEIQFILSSDPDYIAAMDSNHF